MNMPRPSIADRLAKVAYRNQTRSTAKSHILVDTAICNSTCPHQCTTYICPANCYTKDPVRGVIFQFEDCIECGACLYACDQQAVSWSFPHPADGRGINWRQG